MVSEILRQNGYSTAFIGKNHNIADWETSVSGPFDRWPSRQGFDHFYGFVGGEANQWAPALYRDTSSAVNTKNRSHTIVATIEMPKQGGDGVLVAAGGLMQPMRIPNIGLLAYKPPPATVITYPAGALSDVTRAMPPPSAPSTGSPGNLPEETTPTVIQGPEPKALAAMAAMRPVKERPTRRPVRPRKPAAAQATVRSRPQPSGGLAAAYPGYAAVR
jgi:hypothetical protein